MMNSLLKSYGDFSFIVNLIADTDTKFDASFTSEFLYLEDEQHLTEKNGSVLSMSKELAEKNDLKLDDKLTVCMSDY